MAEILRTKLPNPDATIAIITPYRAQKVWVACEIPKSLKTEVLTINECQGNEGSVVCIMGCWLTKDLNYSQRLWARPIPALHFL